MTVNRKRSKEEDTGSEETEDEGTHSDGSEVDPDTHLTPLASKAAPSDPEDSLKAVEAEANQSDAEVDQINLRYSTEKRGARGSPPVRWAV